MKVEADEDKTTHVDRTHLKGFLTQNLSGNRSNPQPLRLPKFRILPFYQFDWPRVQLFDPVDEVP
jgi:hypothetical protein